MYINIYSYVNSHVVLVVSNYLVINIFRGNSKYMNIHVYCTCIRAHKLTTIVPKQGFTLKKRFCSIIAQSILLVLFMISDIYIVVQKQHKAVHISVYSNQEKPV